MGGKTSRVGCAKNRAFHQPPNNTSLLDFGALFLVLEAKGLVFHDLVEGWGVEGWVDV